MATFSSLAEKPGRKKKQNVTFGKIKRCFSLLLFTTFLRFAHRMYITLELLETDLLKKRAQKSHFGIEKRKQRGLVSFMHTMHAGNSVPS